MTSILKEAWNTAHKSKDKEKINSAIEDDKESNEIDHNEDEKLEQQGKGDRISTNNIIF